MRSSHLAVVLGVSLGSTGAAVAAVAMQTGPFNYALGRPTSGDVAFGFPTSNGVDGSTATFTHADNTVDPFWQVDLGGVNFDTLVIHDRIGCCDPNRLNGSVITVLDSIGSAIGSPIALSGFLPNSPAGSSSMTFTNGGLGWSGASSIRIDGANQYFQFSELEAIGTATIPINWALGGSAAFFDNTGSSYPTWPDLPASNVIDGNLGTLTHGDNPLPHGGYYIEVDLGQEILIDNVNVYGRDILYERLEDYQVAFLDAEGMMTYLYTHDGQTTQLGTNIDVIGAVGGDGARAQYVRLINANGADYGAQVAEIQVFGVIPEPSNSLLAALGGLLLLRRRR